MTVFCSFSGQRERQPRHLQTAAHRLLHASAQLARWHRQSRLSLHPGEDSAQGHLLRGAGKGVEPLNLSGNVLLPQGAEALVLPRWPPSDNI